MAGLCVACKYGLIMDEGKALGIARDKYVGMDIHKSSEAHKFDALPSCCEESADCLEKARDLFEADGVFPPRMIDGILKSLRSFHDRRLLAEAMSDKDRLRVLVNKYFYCG